VSDQNAQAKEESSEQTSALSQVVKERLQPLLDLIANTDVEVLSLEQGGVRIAIERTAQVASVVSTSPTPAEEEIDKPEMHFVLAGWVGVFSRSRSQDQLPVIDEGAAVEEGQLLGYIEVLNVLNEVHTPYAGRLERFLVESTQPVEYGQPLALIEPAPAPPMDGVE
jgi:oxaloacetate decarboxylase alpha subunit/acetyl-CoA carboxylase biotin carboxyl carrier protein